MTLRQQFQFTPAALRAVTAAAQTGTATFRIDSASLLFGLLEEPESRAAGVLVQHGITAEEVVRRWPDLAPPNPHPSVDRTSLAAPLEAALVDVVIRWSEFIARVEVATEHLLLAVLGVNDDVADFLSERGLDAGKLETHWLSLHGHANKPLSFDELALTSEPGASATGVNRSTPDLRSLTLPAHHESSASAPLMRILDAAANRAREALRVIEDYVRFVLDDAQLTVECKAARHSLQLVLAALPQAELLASRETTADVGTAISTASERARVDVDAVLTANFKRLEESLRSLEEYAKVVDPVAAAELERLRYRTYTLERAIGMTAESRERMAAVRLYVLLDGRPSLAEFEQLAARLVEAGVHAVQLRDKMLGDRELLDRAKVLRRLTRAGGVLMIVNDRPDLAVLSDADGVHVGQEELSAKEARTIVGPRRLVGVSTHSLEQARAAVLDGANYLGVGPVFASKTKSFGHFVGVDLLRDVAREITLPALAIGGIDATNVRQVLDVGFTRIAVSAAVCEANDPAAAVRTLLAELDGATER